MYVVPLAIMSFCYATEFAAISKEAKQIMREW